MAEYSRLAKGTFTSTGASRVINLPFVPDYVEMVNYSAAKTPANHGIPFAKWDVNFVDGANIPTVIELFNATPVLTTDTVAVNGISVFQAGQLLQFGARQQVVASTKANPTSFQVTGHGYQSGDVVMFTGLYSTQFSAGMPQMSDIPFTITRTDANNFTVPWDSTGSNYTALAASPAGAFVKKVLYPYIYYPQSVVISGITVGATTTIDTASAHNFVVGQEVAFRIPSAWGTIELNSLPNNTSPGSPIYGYVISVTDYNTVIVNINSSSFTAFNVNQTVASVPGLTPPQISGIGDVNTGGVVISSGSPLYPSPQYIPIGTTPFSTINGPAISGAYVNNTSQGFIIGAGVGVNDATAVLVGANGNLIEWRAFLHDYSSP